MKMMGLDPTRVDTSAKFALGTRGEDHAGREFVYVQADAAMTAGDCAIIDDDYTAEGITSTNAAAGTGYGKMVGLPLTDFALDEFGWLCIYGTGTDVLVKLGAAAVAFTRLRTTATAGELDDSATATDPYIRGLVIKTASGGADELEIAVLNYPHVELDLII